MMPSYSRNGSSPARGFRIAKHLDAYWASVSLAVLLALIISVSASPLVPRAFAAPPAECDIPTTGGWTKLSKCIPSGVAPNVVLGGSSTTADSCGEKGPVNVYVDTGKPADFGKITINAGSVLKVFDRTAQVPVFITTTGFDVFGNLEIGDVKCPIG